MVLCLRKNEMDQSLMANCYVQAICNNTVVKQEESHINTVTKYVLKFFLNMNKSEFWLDLFSNETLFQTFPSIIGLEQSETCLGQVKSSRQISSHIVCSFFQENLRLFATLPISNLTQDFFQSFLSLEPVSNKISNFLTEPKVCTMMACWIHTSFIESS